MPYAIAGFGRIGRRLAERLPGVVAVLARSPAAAGVPVYTNLDDVLRHRPRVVVECASREALAAIGPAVLADGCDLVPLSLTALADPEVRQALSKQGMEATSSTPEQMRDIVKTDIARWSAVIDDSMKQKK